MVSSRTSATGLIILFVTVSGTGLHGWFSNRWGNADEALRLAAHAIAATPKTCGSWTKIEEREFPSNVPGILNFAGAVNSVYYNEASGQTIAVAIIVGPPGPTSTHVAEMCYNTRGYKLLAGPDEMVIARAGSGEDRFRQSLFESDSFEKQRLEVCYSWRASDFWEVPTVPRLSFGNARRLFKIQLAAEFGADAPSTNDSVCRQFLQAFLPAMETHVFQQLTN